MSDQRVDQQIASLTEMICRQTGCTVAEAMQKIKNQHPTLIRQYREELLSVLPSQPPR